jgi:pimeloyl-ACP methyl ester carboxylesterase
LESPGLRDPNSSDQTPFAGVPTEGRCPAPANFRAEVTRFDRDARVEAWDGPRYRMTYRVLGDGPLLILVPGIATTYRLYALLLIRLSERFRTVIYDYPGEHADDRARLGRISHDDLADDLLGLVDHLGLGPAFPVGLSFGSTVVLNAAARAPERFPRLALQGGFARRRFSIAERVAFAVGRRIPGTLDALPLRETVLRYNFQAHFPNLIADRWTYFMEQNGLTPIRTLSHRLSLLRTLDLRPILGRVSADVLALQGNEDRLITRQSHDELVAGLPSARSVVMPNVGHQPYLTHAEALADVIGHWLVPCEPSECISEGSSGGCSGIPGLCGGDRAGGCHLSGETQPVGESGRAR